MMCYRCIHKRKIDSQLICSKTGQVISEDNYCTEGLI